MSEGRSGLRPGRRVGHRAHTLRRVPPLPIPMERVSGPRPEEGPTLTVVWTGRRSHTLHGSTSAHAWSSVSSDNGGIMHTGEDMY